jgi:hypothetical protein
MTSEMIWLTTSEVFPQLLDEFMSGGDDEVFEDAISANEE